MPFIYDAVFCDHSEMKECCPGCGHFSCPCGIAWDEAAEGPGPFEEDELEDAAYIG